MTSLENSQIPELTREPLKNQVANYIKELILTNVLVPGERIIPGKMAVDLKTGRGVIREALMLLESEGLIKNLPYGGSFVATYDLREMEEICSVRIMLESYAIKNQYDKITENDFTELKKICDSMQFYVEQQKIVEVLKYDALFHGYFVKKESRSGLYEAWNISTSKIAMVYSSLLNGGYTMEETAQNHYRLLDALRVSSEKYLETLYEHYMKVSQYITIQENIH